MNGIRLFAKRPSQKLHTQGPPAQPLSMGAASPQLDRKRMARRLGRELLTSQSLQGSQESERAAGQGAKGGRSVMLSMEGRCRGNGIRKGPHPRRKRNHSKVAQEANGYAKG